MNENDDLFYEMAARRRKLEQLRRDVQIGIDEIARGEFAPWDVEEIKRKGRELLRRQLNKDPSN